MTFQRDVYIFINLVNHESDAMIQLTNQNMINTSYRCINKRWQELKLVLWEWQNAFTKPIADNAVAVKVSLPCLSFNCKQVKPLTEGEFISDAECII